MHAHSSTEVTALINSIQAYAESASTNKFVVAPLGILHTEVDRPECAEEVCSNHYYFFVSSHFPPPRSWMPVLLSSSAWKNMDSRSFQVPSLMPTWSLKSQHHILTSLPFLYLLKSSSWKDWAKERTRPQGPPDKRNGQSTV